MDAQYEPIGRWPDFLHYLGEFYNMGEYGIIYSTKWWPERVVKVVNCDITDGEGNADQTAFFQEFWGMEISGLPVISAFCRTKLTEPLKTRLEHGIAGTSADYQAAMNVLDMEIGDEIGMWVMEKAAYIGLTHPRMTKREMIKRVAQAAYNVGRETDYGISDLKESNYGFREDGSAFIFDFNYEDQRHSLEEYEENVSNLLM